MSDPCKQQGKGRDNYCRSFILTIENAQVLVSSRVQRKRLKEIWKRFKRPVNCLQSWEERPRQDLFVKTAGMQRKREIAAAEIAHGL